MSDYPWESSLIAHRMMRRQEWYVFWSRYRLHRRAVRRGWEGTTISLREFAMRSAFSTAAQYADSLWSALRVLTKPPYRVPYAVSIGTDPLAPRNWFDRGLYRALDFVFGP